MPDPRAQRNPPPPRSWAAAFARLTSAERAGPLDAGDLERLALSAYMLGQDEECAAAWLRAHQAWLSRGNARRAARCAFWQAWGLLFKGEQAPAMGWIARGRRVLETVPEECVEHGWLLAITAFPQLLEGDVATAAPRLDEAQQIAARFGDPDLLTIVRLGQGQALALQGRLADGLALLDEVMVAVVAGELSPLLTGVAYCMLIATCQDVFDLRRAREWTAALARWCAAQPDLVPYRGNCLVHRCELLQLQGAWPDALDAAQQACRLLSGPSPWDTLGSAYYQLGEIERLRGAFEQAEAAYRHASRAGRDPEPGLALLRLAQGRRSAAVAGIRRALAERADPLSRSKVLPAAVEILVAARDVPAARAAADELGQSAAALRAPYALALAAQASGLVLLAEGDARTALTTLRGAAARWRELEAPYQLATTRALLGLACRALDDGEGAQLEFDAAREAFERLGALPDLERLDHLTSAAVAAAASGLTAREREVLALLATGQTNRAIAEALFISEKTVARHVSNIFTKLDLATRAEATAYAYEHGLTR